MTDKGVAQAKDVCSKAKVASEEAADLLKSAYTTVARQTTISSVSMLSVPTRAPRLTTSMSCWV
jgi:hypothetical protein